jgi:hypothetical protein
MSGSKRLSVYLPISLHRQVVAEAKQRHCSESSLIAGAVKAQLARKVGDDESNAARQTARLNARLEKLIGEQLIAKEIVLMFVRVWLEHNPPLDESIAESAAASADARFERFLDLVAQSLTPGGTLATAELTTAPLTKPASAVGAAAEVHA